MAEYHMPRVDAGCAHRGCPNYADEGDLCSPHAWEAEHPGRSYDPFDHFPAEPKRAVFHRFVKTAPSAPEEHRTGRSASGMGGGQHSPSNQDSHKKRDPPPQPEWPGGYPARIDATERETAHEPGDDPASHDDDAEHLWFVEYVDMDASQKHSGMVTGEELRDLGKQPNINLKTVLRDDDDDCPENAETESHPSSQRHFVTRNHRLIDADTGAEWSGRSDAEGDAHDDDWQPQDLKDLYRLYREQDERDDNDEPEDDENDEGDDDQDDDDEDEESDDGEDDWGNY